MARREKRMEKEKVPPPESRLRDPMSVVVEKLGDRSARVHGDLSKETLRELLMSSMMLLPKVQSTMSTPFRDMLDPLKKGIDGQGIDGHDIDGRGIDGQGIDGRGIDGQGIDGQDIDGQDIDAQGISTRRQDDITTQRGISGKKKKKEKLRREQLVAKKRGRMRMKMWDDVMWDRDRWDLYGEASTDEELDKKLVEDDGEVESLPTCPSTLTEDLDLSYDGKWLRSNMRTPLRMAFKEIVAKKPYDPVSYLGFWLLNYKKCQEDSKRRAELDEELRRLRRLLKQPTPEEVTIEDLQMIQVEEGEEEANVGVDWNFQFND